MAVNATNNSTPFVTATLENQIVQSTVTVTANSDGTGNVTAQVGHFGQTYTSPNTTSLSVDDFTAFRGAIETAARAPLKRLSGTALTTDGSQNGTFAMNYATGGEVTIKSIARNSKIGKPDVIEVRDVPETEQALTILAAHLGGPFEITDPSGLQTTLQAELMPANPKQG